MRSLTAVALLLSAAIQARAAEEKGPNAPPWSSRVETVLEVTEPLAFARGDRLPLYLWPATNPGDLDDRTAERLVRELDRRGVGLIASWSPARREESLSRALPIARAQKKLGLRVNVNANACMYRFFNGDEATAHVDARGQPFWDESFDTRGRPHHMGCPFTLDLRKDAIRGQVEWFARAYREAGLDIDFLFADWEIDGPLEVNRAHEASKRCARCREAIAHVDSFLEFQKVLREMRSELQRYALAEPVLSRFPDALVGNYAVYPHDGFRYWYDYFEQFVEGQPHVADQRAKYRHWANDFAGTGYTFAMPVVYTWYPTYGWYDFENTDYRWFYNMLLVATNACRHTPENVPIISFVHWHTTAPPEKPDPSVKQLSREAYQELLWHMLLRGTDGLFLWCPKDEDAEEVRLVHEVYAAAQQYGEFLDKGTPIAFDVPKTPGPVVSALLLDGRVLVRRTEFTESREPVTIRVGNRELPVRAGSGKCQVLSLR